MSITREKQLLELAKQLQPSFDSTLTLPSDVVPPVDQPVLPHSLFRGTRGYLERVVYQINRTYMNTCYDACAVMIRRMLEILIIETYEQHNMRGKIQHSDGNYVMLAALVAAVLAEPQWSIGRQAKKAIRKMKTVGDQSAHSLRYNAKREYIDDMIIDLRSVAEELLYLSGLRK